MEEDPSVFAYDEVYDDMKEKAARPKMQDKVVRESKYIAALKEKAEQRKREQDIIYERKLHKERSKEDHLFADKDKFVTSAYRKKLEEERKWLEEEKRRQRQEEKEDPDLSLPPAGFVVAPSRINRRPSGFAVAPSRFDRLSSQLRLASLSPLAPTEGVVLV